MKCPRCNGKRCEPDNSGCLVWRACKMCHGTGIVPDNNEYWFCSLSTEEKAKYIAKSMYFYDVGMPMGEALRASIRHEQGLNRTLEDDVIEWLKQPHKGD